MGKSIFKTTISTNLSACPSQKNICRKKKLPVVSKISVLNRENRASFHRKKNRGKLRTLLIETMFTGESLYLPLKGLEERVISHIKELS